MARVMQGNPVKLTLDFDGTLTKKDTLHVVAGAGYQRHRIDSSTKALPPWEDIVDAYLSDYGTHTTEFNQGKPERKTLLEEVSWLNSLQHVERASADRVVKAGMFNHVTQQDMDDAATSALQSKNIELRPGWAELLTTAYDYSLQSNMANHKHMLQVVSVNWSRWFVWAALWNGASLLEDQKLTERVKQALQTTAVYANEIESIMSELKPSGGPQGEPKTLRTASDKLRQMSLDVSTPKDHPSPLQVYIGDSITDLECLVMADVGICVQDRSMSSSQKELVSTCGRVGIQLKSLSEYQPTSRKSTTLKKFKRTFRGTLAAYTLCTTFTR